MESAEKDERGSPPLQIDPKCLQDALRAFLEPTKTDDPRVDFYNIYKREAAEFDMSHIQKYNDVFDTTLIFGGLFSIVCSVFVIDIHSKLQPDPNDQSAALLRAILLTLNQTAIPGETPVVPPVQEGPQGEIVIVTSLMYASLLISLLAMFIAMLGKRWLSRYLCNSGGSVIDRCGDRQRKYDGLEKSSFHLFAESLPVMLQVALLLFACGLCQYMWSINTSVTYVLISLTALGVAFYVAIVIVGTSSYASPFQTPMSVLLRGQWNQVRDRVVAFVIHSKRVLSWTPSLLTVPLGNVQVQQPEPWLKSMDLNTIRRTNTNDLGCVSWILRSITDPEALDAAIRLAGVIWWFADGINTEPPYGLIVSIFAACFDSTGKLYPGSRDRAYYSGRAILWIHALAVCKSQEIFPFPIMEYTAPGLDPDLEHLLFVSGAQSVGSRLIRMLNIHQCTPSHSQWISNILLHLSWANRTVLDFGFIPDCISSADETTIPLNATLNRLLVWCIFLGSPVEEEVLKIQDKSDHMERVLHKLSEAIISTVNGTETQRKFIPHVLRDLIKLENRPRYLTELAYEWCAVIYENHQRLGGWENLLLTCLEIGFRHLDPQSPFIGARLSHTEYHRGLVDVVFKGQETEAIADLLHAWTTRDDSSEPAYALLDLCTGHLVDLQNLVPFSSRLRRLVIRSVELIGYEGFEGVEVERFIQLLNHLRVTVKDMDRNHVWTRLLLDILKSSEGAQQLSHWYWELLVELAILVSPWLKGKIAYSPEITTSLVEAQEWSRLECWMGTVWLLWPPGADGMAEEDLDRPMLLLFRHRPGAIQKLEGWMERWSKECGEDVPESFQRICEQAGGATQLDAPPISSTKEDSENPFIRLHPEATGSESRYSISNV